MDPDQLGKGYLLLTYLSFFVSSAELGQQTLDHGLRLGKIAAAE